MLKDPTINRLNVDLPTIIHTKEKDIYSKEKILRTKSKLIRESEKERDKIRKIWWKVRR